MSLRTLCRHRGGFTAVDLIVVVAVIAILAALSLVVLNSFFHPGCSIGKARGMANSTQLRGIHQGMVTYAQSNKKGGNDGYFPGLDSSGNVVPDGPDTGHSGDGTEPGARLWLLLQANAFTPEYIINPADNRAIEAEMPPGAIDYGPLTSENHSFAMLGIAEVHRKTEAGFAEGDDRRAVEWKETLNANAIVLSDRAIGTGRSDISSVWTEADSGDWRGTVTKNDNSTSFETVAEFEQTRYGDADPNALDHLFEDAPNADDAFFVFEDAVTAYSSE